MANIDWNQSSLTAPLSASQASKLQYNPDGSPVRPDIISVIDQNGNLLPGQEAQFQQIDPSNLSGYNMLKNLATSAGPTDIAKSQMDLANQARVTGLNNAALTSQQATSQGLNNLSMRGGASSGSRALLAAQGSKNLLNANQAVNLQNTNDQMKIASEDASRKLDLLNNFSGMENTLASTNNNIANQQTQFNKQLQGTAIGNYNENLLDAYKSELDKWGANQQANATASSSGGGGGGCCFIFLEARYGDGTMDAVVRRFRDEHMTVTNRRGYYKVSEVLVPLMRKSKLAKALVRFTMTDPMVAYGKAFYGGSKLGFVFAPVAKFWLNAFEYLGQDHAFIRENGEII